MAPPLEAYQRGARRAGYASPMKVFGVGGYAEMERASLWAEWPYIVGIAGDRPAAVPCGSHSTTELSRLDQSDFKTTAAFVMLARTSFRRQFRRKVCASSSRWLRHLARRPSHGSPARAALPPGNRRVERPARMNRPTRWKVPAARGIARTRSLGLPQRALPLPEAREFEGRGRRGRRCYQVVTRVNREDRPGLPSGNEEKTCFASSSSSSPS